MSKAVGLIDRALERKSIQQPHYKPGVPLCSLGVYDKFMRFIDNAGDPLTLMSAEIDAAEDQAARRDKHFGPGTAGFAMRLTAQYTDRISSRFFADFAYPSLFGEDPRYYRLGNGATTQRLAHAAEHLFVAHRPDGTRMFNYSRWLGTATTIALSPLYHPGNERGAGAVARNLGYAFAWDVGFDVLKEFWPDINRKLRLPLRGAARTFNQAPSQPASEARD